MLLSTDDQASITSDSSQDADSVNTGPGDVQHEVISHGLRHLYHVPCDKPPRHITCGKGLDFFISLHSNGPNRFSSVCFYNTDGSIREPSSPGRRHTVPYLGLTVSQLPGQVVGWGPGAVFDLLDTNLRPLARAENPVDVRACMVTDNPIEVVTTGLGNVCLWCLTHMVCQVRVVEGLEGQRFTQLALGSHQGSQYGFRAFAVCGNTVTSVDIKKGEILARKVLHPGDITGIAHCAQLDFLVSASKDLTIRVWGPDWELKFTLVGHTDMVTSMLCCPTTGYLLSCSEDKTLRCWSLEEGDEMTNLRVPGTHPPLAIGGPDNTGTFFTFSNSGVDLWTITSLFHLHCKLNTKDPRPGPVRQMLVTPYPPPYPARVLCVHGDRDVTLVSAGTGAVLTGLRLESSRVLCADYFLPKEAVLVLTEDGVVLTANALSNPMTVVGKWSGEGQDAGQWAELGLGEGDSQDLGPGPACSMVLYSSMPDRKTALAEWRSLQEQRGKASKKPKYVNDPKNKCLVMVGHRGGYLSVLKLHTKRVQFRTPVHKGQDVTVMQAYPDNNYLLTAGKDLSVLVWRVFLYAEECLNLHMSVYCGQPPLHLGLMGPLLALTFEEPENATYSLAYYHMEHRRRMDHPPKEDHLGSITGLSVNLQLKVFASSSEDGTVRIWDEDNRLVRTLPLLTEPECLAFVAQTEQLLVGIRGDLYYISTSEVMPQDLPLQAQGYEKVEPAFPDLPIPRKATSQIKQRMGRATLYSCEDDVALDPILVALQLRNKDLENLQQGEIEIKRKARKRSKAFRQQVKKEAFDTYMKLVYKEPFKVDIPDQDLFDLHHIMFPPTHERECPAAEPDFSQGFFPKHSEAQRSTLIMDQTDQETTDTTKTACQKNLGFVPNSVLVEQLWPKEEEEQPTPTPSPTEPTKEWKLRDFSDTNSEHSTMFMEDEENSEAEDSDEELLERLIYQDAEQRERSKGPKKKKQETPAEEEAPAVEEEETSVKSKTPVPRKSLPPVKDIPIRKRVKQPSPPPERTPSPVVPRFLKQFLQEPWFKSLYPVQNSIPESLCADDFAKQVLEVMQDAAATVKLQLMTALLTLCEQGAMQDPKIVFRGLVGCLCHSITASMGLTGQTFRLHRAFFRVTLKKALCSRNVCHTASDHRFANELLNLLVCLCPDDPVFMVELLVIMAYTQLGFHQTVLSLLQRTGLNEDVTKVTEEFKTWQLKKNNQLGMWQSLRISATDFLNEWIEKYKKENRDQGVLSLKTGVTLADVLNFYCSVPEIEESQTQLLLPLRREKDAVLIPALPPTPKPMQRLGEMYTMTRTRVPRGIVLPPLNYRPLLLGFTRFLKLPLPQLFLDPFEPFAVDPHCLKPQPTSNRRLFMLEKSFVSYYR